MYCGNCFRDNALVGALRRLQHSTLFVPLYLPMSLEVADESAGTPVFFNGISVYLEQKSAFFRHAPAWLHRFLGSPRLLGWAAGVAGKTRAQDLGEMTLSILRGEEGNQTRELDALIAWLRTQPPADVICLSNVLLVGMARHLKRDLGAPVVCVLQGEDSFLDALPKEVRQKAWDLTSARARDVDRFIAPSRYFSERMRARLHLPEEKVRVVPNGIALDGFQSSSSPPQPPVLGFFARMCREKGLDTLVDAYLLLKQRPAGRNLRLHVGGSCGPSDEAFVKSLQARLARHAADVSFFPNVDRNGKQEFFRSISVFSVPARYGEAFGLYLLEAWAAGVPVVQPWVASFPELIESTGGGVLCAPDDPKALADAIEGLIEHPNRAAELGRNGRQAVQERYSIEWMAQEILKVYQEVAPGQSSG